MADRNRYQENLANEIHDAERAVAKAAGMPAGPTRVVDVLKAQENLLRLEQQYDHCQSGQASPMIKLHR
jgi:hypothetical protein